MTASEADLVKEIKDLEVTLESLRKQRQDTEMKLKNSTDPSKAIQRHIKLLHEYNEIRDVALNFVGKIAEKERCRAIDVLKDYDIDEKD